MRRPGQKAMAGALGLALLLSASMAHAERAYWIDGRKIRSARLDGTDLRDLVIDGVQQPATLAVDPAAGMMYWIDQGNGILFQAGHILRARLDGSGVQELTAVPAVNNGVVSPVLRLTPTKMYWSSDDGTIRRANLDGASPQLLVDGQQFVRALVLAPATGKMYWAEQGRIQRANLDGSSVEPLVVAGAQESISGLALDPARGKMYWVVAPFLGPSLLRRANLDGSQVEDLFGQDMIGSLSLSVDPVAGKVYWTSFQPPAGFFIRRSSLDGSNVETVMTTPSGPSPLVLDLVGRALYWSEGVFPSVVIRGAGLDGTNVRTVGFLGLAPPGTIAPNPADGKVYWPEALAGRIQRAGNDGSGQQVLLSTVLREGGGLTVDPLGRRMYWRSDAKIYRANLDGSDVAPVLGGIVSDFARALTVDPVGGKLYWTVNGPDSLSGIRRANRDGSDPEDVVINAGARDLAVDPAAGKLYWSLLGIGCGIDICPPPTTGFGIQRANLDGTEAQELVGRDAASVTVDPVAGKMYWKHVGLEFIGEPDTLQRANLDGSHVETLLGNAEQVGGPAVSRATHDVFVANGQGILRLQGSALQLVIPGGRGGVVFDGQPQLPLAGTGRAAGAVGNGFDSFVRVREAVPAAQEAGPVGSRMGALKDVDVDPTTGLLYTIDVMPAGDGQQVYVVDPLTGRGTPLPQTTGLAAPAFIWGLAFDGQGKLYGGGRGVYGIDKQTGRALPVATLDQVPALILGMAASRDGVGFLSTGLLLAPNAAVPYVAQHAADGTFLPGRVFPVVDSLGQGRVLVDIAGSVNGFLYGDAWPAGLFGGAGGAASGEPPSVPAVMAAIRTAPPGTLEARAQEEAARMTAVQAAADAGSDLVLVQLVGSPSLTVARLSSGSPLPALLLGLGRTFVDLSPPVR